MRLSTKIFIGFIVIILLAIISFFVNLRLSDDVNRNTEFLTNSESIIRNSTRLHNGIVEMQSSFRGFLLTGNENFLQSYYEGLKEIPPLFQEEKILIGDSRSQLQKLDSIKKLHESWVEYSSSLIDAKRRTISEDLSTEYLDLFENKLQKEVGKKINDEINVKFKEFDRYEYKVREGRRERLQSSIAVTRNTSLILVIVTIVVGIISAVYITLLISKRISSMVGLADRIAKGEFEVIEDTAKDELSDLSKSLNVMSGKLNKSFKELERKNKELDQFAYVVSHDLKAPLRGMYNIFTWIEEDLGGELSNQLKKYLEMMKGRIHRLENLITGLLEYARIGRVVNPHEDVNIGDLLIEIKEMVVPPGFNMLIKKNMPVINTEKLRLQQVFTNLISNAVKYNGRDKGSVIVDCTEFQNYFQFSIADNGIGIAPEYHEKIFGIFQTLREKNELESTGVGLAIVKKIIEDKKGSIKVISNNGEGTTFIFTWPKERIVEPQNA
jgi:signal transduction histidine kinase